MKYLKFKSLTFWSGIALALVPLVKAFGIEIPDKTADVITSVAGGTGLIGLRAAATKLLS